jgi:hypothetical protein
MVVAIEDHEGVCVTEKEKEGEGVTQKLIGSI